jgi:hypothetical protein
MLKVFLLLALLWLPVLADDTDEKALREEYGLTQLEWRKFKESGMSLDKLEEIQGIGITINEYLSKPWISLGISESKWLTEKKKGLEDDDISAEYTPDESSNSVLWTFVLPGYHQFKTKSYMYGGLYTLTAGLGWFAYLAIPDEGKKTLDPNNPGQNIKEPDSKQPLFAGLALAGHFLSAIHAYIDIKKSRSQGLSRKWDIQIIPGPDYQQVQLAFKL